MTDAEIVRAARELISKRENWTKGTAARDANGETTSSNDPNACKFCAIGAILRCGGEMVTIMRVERAASLPHPAGSSMAPLAYLNDYKGHEAVLKVFDTYLENNP